ncbi:CD033 protein, partial [Leiothrix lutea]|nr:CD033 protein [Leiothrix lutea]
MQYLKMEFRIKHRWDGLPVSHEPVTIVLRPDNAGLLMEVQAPFFNDPPAPPGEPGKPFGGLWDYEGLQVTWALISHSCTNYQRKGTALNGLELWLTKEGLPLEFEVTRMKTQWEGKALLPWSYFPPCTDKFNAFAIHGSGEERQYEALYPVPPHELQEGQKPDFHRLEFFQDLNLKELTGEDWKQPESDIWKSH